MLFPAWSFPLEEKPVRIVYSYRREKFDSLEIIIEKNGYIIHQRNYQLIPEIDSTNNITYATPDDKIVVVLRGYQQNLYCYPFIDPLVYPNMRISYGLDFGCEKLKK
jgi:hypothetical protein